MRIFHLIFIGISALMLSRQAFGARAMTPEEAVHVLEVSSNITEVGQALQVASASPATRQAAIAYFDGPSRWDQFSLQFIRTHLPVSDEIVADREKLQEWANEWKKDHPDEVKQFNDAWDAEINNAVTGLAKFFAHSQDPALFEVYKHLSATRMLEPQTSGGGFTLAFLDELPADSPLEPLFIEYVTTSKRFSNASTLLALSELKGAAAYAKLREMILADKTKYDDYAEILTSLPYPYTPQVIPVYQAMLVKAGDEHGSVVVASLLGAGPAGYAAPTFEGVDPAVYPLILQFIETAEKMKLSLIATRTLADAKAKILALQAKRGNGAALPTSAATTSTAPDSVLAPSAVPPAAAPKPPAPPAPPAATTPATTPFPTAWAAVAALVLLAGGFALWRFKKR